ncbi:MAG: polysaccharide biosynthesis tyrosine autokinase [Gemmatimonadota bacterium]|nr:polysaccharide biosynthesis tyrosine autokinase [Gemmatimonadota bacterium]
MEQLPILADPGDANQEIDLRRAWQTVARSAWIIVICIGLATAAAMLAVRRIDPVFSSSATVRIEEKNQGGSAFGYFAADYTNVLATATQILTSRQLAYDVVDSLGMRLGLYQPVRRLKSEVVRLAHVSADAPSQAYRLDRTGRGMREVRLLPSEKVLGSFPDSLPIPIEGGWIQLAGGATRYDRLVFTVFPRNDVASALRDAIRVSQAGRDANVLRIAYTGKDPVEAMQVPNVLARAYVKRRIDLAASGARSTVSYLERQVAVVGEQLNEQETKIRDYLLSRGVSSIDGKIQDLVSELNLLRSNMTNITLERDAIARAIAPLRENGVDGADEFLRRAMATPEFLGIATTEVGNLQGLRTERDALLQRRTADDPDVKSLNTRMDVVRERIQDRAAAFLSQRNSLVEDRQHRVDSLQRALALMPEEAMGYQRLERDRLVLQETMGMVQGRLKEAEITASVPDSSASLLDDAVSADQQANSSQTLIFAVAIFSGLLVGVGVAFLRDWLDTTIHDESDLRAIVGVPVVGIIPNLQQQSRSGAYRLPPTEAEGRTEPARDRAAASGSSAPGSAREYHTPAAEAYRALRTNLNYLTPPRAPRVIVVTSALPGDGKTTTVVNLAITLAQQGQRVILIDAETRRGTVHEAFGIPPAPGFFDLMYGQASPGECIRRVSMETGGSVDVLPLGSPPSVNPADLLVATRLQPLFDRLRQQYDYVLLDTPPLNLFTDAALIASNADALLLVARSDKTDRDELKFAVAQLRNVQVVLAGAVLNDVELRRGSRYRQGYGYYYEYGR